MADPSPYLQILASVPTFDNLDHGSLEALYRACSLRVFEKGEAVTVAGTAVTELFTVVSGRFAPLDLLTSDGEAGRGAAVEMEAFFSRRPARATFIAIRESVALGLSWDDWFAALRGNPHLLDAMAARLADPSKARRLPAPKPSRLLICPISEDGLPGEQVDALLASLETLAETRLLSKTSFGSDHGGIALSAPDATHWLQEQELEFDLTVIVGGASDPGFTEQNIEEADEILFVGNASEDAALSPFERHALETRGPARCRVVTPSPSDDNALPPPRRPYRSTQVLDFSSTDSLGLLSSLLLGQGRSLAAVSRGVHAAAILGALQAFEASGHAPNALVAAGSAILPAGLLAAGAPLAHVEAVFRHLSHEDIWRRAARHDFGLFDAARLDEDLGAALSGFDIAAGARPFIAVSHAMSDGTALLQRDGPLQVAVRAGLTPPGILPPYILDDGTILVSGEHDAESLLNALRALTPSPATLICPGEQPLGRSTTPYHHLAEGTALRLTPFHSLGKIDARIQLETILGSSVPLRHSVGEEIEVYAVPIPAHIQPMHWARWEELRDVAFEWTTSELARRSNEGSQHRP